MEIYNIICLNTPNLVNNIKLWQPTKNNNWINDDNNEVVKCTSIHNSLKIQKNCHSRNLELDVQSGGFITTNWNESSLLHNHGSLLQKNIMYGHGCSSPPIGICLLFPLGVRDLQKIKQAFHVSWAYHALTNGKLPQIEHFFSFLLSFH